MSGSQSSPKMTEDEYLMFEQRSKVRHEFVDGYLFAMTGASEAHNVIAGKLFSLLHVHLKGSRCRAFIVDMEVQVKAANSFYYPNIMVRCEPIEPKSDFKAAPVLIVEVSSPSTRQVDRREKMVAYRKLDSLRNHLIVQQNEVLIELHEKQPMDNGHRRNFAPAIACH